MNFINMLYAEFAKLFIDRQHVYCKTEIYIFCYTKCLQKYILFGNICYWNSKVFKNIHPRFKIKKSFICRWYLKKTFTAMIINIWFSCRLTPSLTLKAAPWWVLKILILEFFPFCDFQLPFKASIHCFSHSKILINE